MTVFLRDWLFSLGVSMLFLYLSYIVWFIFLSVNELFFVACRCRCRCYITNSTLKFLVGRTRSTHRAFARALKLTGTEVEKMATSYSFHGGLTKWTRTMWIIILRLWWRCGGGGGTAVRPYTFAYTPTDDTRGAEDGGNCLWLFGSKIFLNVICLVQVCSPLWMFYSYNWNVSAFVAHVNIDINGGPYTHILNR